MKQKCVICLAAMLSLIFSLQAQDWDISGVITDVRGLPVSGCKVSLTETGINGTSDATGAFNIKGDPTEVSAPAHRPHPSRLMGQSLYFSQHPEANTLTITLHDSLAGRKLATIFHGRLPEGDYVLQPLAYAPENRTIAMSIVTLNSGGHTASFKLMPAAGAGLSRGIKKMISTSSPLAKQSQAAVDSLLVECLPHLPQQIPLPDYTATVNVLVSPLYDIVVYGGTSAGVIAGVQAASMDKKVLIISPTQRLGGLSAGGLGATDKGDGTAIGGLSKNFYQRIAQKYSEDSRWVQQERSDFANYNAEIMFNFEPKVALEVFQDFIREQNVPVVYRERLWLGGGVIKEGPAINKIIMESGLSFSAKVFIDATYEGDLMAKAGVSYFVGREANSQYGETINGIQFGNKNQLPGGIDPYVTPGDPSSGLLFGINPSPGGARGEGDKNIQAYCFRMTLTDATDNMAAVEKPDGYKEEWYEILLRGLEAGKTMSYGGDLFRFTPMPNRKTDSNNHGGFSTDFIGQNYDYPEGDYATREQIIKNHEIYQKGLLWTIANHPRVPQAQRDKYSKWGLPKDEYTDNGNWSPQLYIREARRMIGELVMTEKHVQQIDPVKVTASVGLGAYSMDSHHTQRYVKDGSVQNEGDVQKRGFDPYPISYRSIVPKKAECTNLIVPVCVSGTHIAHGSIRMEPVFMILGQSAATAASHSIDEGVAVQDIDYPSLRERLLYDKQILETP